MIRCGASFMLAAVTALFLGCASEKQAAPAGPGGSAGPEWRMEGTRLIACCCAAPCS